MVCFDTQGCQAFLHDHADNGPTAPNANDERRSESTVIDLRAKTVTIQQVGFLINKYFLRHAAPKFAFLCPIFQHNHMTTKLYLDAQQLLDDSFQLAANIYESGFRPTAIVAVWRGGTPIALAVQEYFSALQIDTDHIAIRTSAYEGIDGRKREVSVYGLSYLVKNLTHDDCLLLVDDVFDTGRSLEAILTSLRARLRLNMPKEVRIAVPYFKPARNETNLVPDYFLHETEQWIKFPYSLEGLGKDEIAEHRPAIYEVLKPYLK